MMNYWHTWQQEEEQPRAAAFTGSSSHAREERWECRTWARKPHAQEWQKEYFSLENESGDKRCSVLNIE